MLLFFVNQSCNKSDKADINTRGGLALTFDDYSIDNWHKYLNLFDSLGVKAVNA